MQSKSMSVSQGTFTKLKPTPTSLMFFLKAMGELVKKTCQK
jgi:hypothetical protein